MANSKSARMCPISRFKWRDHQQQSVQEQCSLFTCPEIPLLAVQRLGVGPTPGIVAKSPNQERFTAQDLQQSATLFTPINILI
jgi:hypothetical protein